MESLGKFRGGLGELWGCLEELGAGWGRPVGEAGEVVEIIRGRTWWVDRGLENWVWWIWGGFGEFWGILVGVGGW